VILFLVSIFWVDVLNWHSHVLKACDACTNMGQL